MITVTAFKWVPPFAQGQVRDYRVRWVLEEAGLPYATRLIDADVQKSPEYRAQQPFGQVPIIDDDGIVLFETGAILLHVAEKTGTLLPGDRQQRATALSWLFGALNSLEPFLMNLAEVDYFMKDEAQKALRRPGVIEAIRDRLGKAEAWLGDRQYLAGEFSIADMMLAGVLRIADEPVLLADCPKLSAYQARCLARPAFERAVAAQLRDFEGHGPADMKWRG